MSETQNETNSPIDGGRPAAGRRPVRPSSPTLHLPWWLWAFVSAVLLTLVHAPRHLVAVGLAVGSAGLIDWLLFGRLRPPRDESLR